MLLLFTIGLAPLAHAQHYLSHGEVTDLAYAYSAMNRTAPEFLNTAYVIGDGVYVFSDGTYRLENEQNTRNQDIQQQTYDTVMISTGDPIMASQAAAGLLSPDELEEAINREYGGSGYQFLGWSVSPFGNYTGGGEEQYQQ